ncbi:MAG: hypothetical protein NT106_14195 [Candidatus Sumerlaeota bacterium]|nr:hypothetical protein [Candidatus Sumerlaeota bacterium]
MRKEARFLRLLIFPKCIEVRLNPARGRINGGKWGFFDNSCSEIHLPLSGVAGDEITLEIETEEAFCVEGDDRVLALPVHGIEYLF